MDALVPLLFLLVAGAGGRGHANMAAAGSATPASRTTAASNLYWQAVLPDTPMPLAVRAMLTQQSTEHSSIHVKNMIEEDKVHTADNCHSQRHDRFKTPRKIGPNSKPRIKMEKYDEDPKKITVSYGSQVMEDPKMVTLSYGLQDMQDPKKVTMSYGFQDKEDSKKVTMSYRSHIMGDPKKVTLSYGSHDMEDLKKATTSYEFQDEEDPKKATMLYGAEDANDPKMVTLSYASEHVEHQNKVKTPHGFQDEEDPKKITLSYRSQVADDPKKVTLSYGSQDVEDSKKVTMSYVSQYEHDSKKVTVSYRSQVADDPKKATLSYGSQDVEDPKKVTLSYKFKDEGEDPKKVTVSHGSQVVEDPKKITLSYGSRDIEDPKKATTSYVSQYEQVPKKITVSYGSQVLDDPKKVTLLYESQDVEDPNKVTSSYRSQDEEDPKKVTVSYGSQVTEDPKITTSYGSQEVGDSNKVTMSYEFQDVEDPKRVTMSYGSQNLDDPITSSYGSRVAKDPEKITLSYGSKDMEDTKKVTISYNVHNEEDPEKATVEYGSRVIENSKQNNVMEKSQDNWKLITIFDNHLSKVKAVSKGDKQHAHIHSGSETLADVFFFHDTLRLGSVITPTIPPTTSVPPLLPHHIADRIPFSTERFSDIIAMLAPASQAMAGEIRWTLNTCENPRPQADEKAGCANSLESLADLAPSLLRTRDVHAFSGNMPVDPAGTPARRGPYKIVAVRRLSGESQQIATCHDLTYPYAVFFCHTTSPAVAYAVTLEMADVDNGVVPVSADGAMEVLVVCHLDTSQWSPKNPFFVVHNLKPGETAVCHFLSKLSIVWVPTVDAVI